MMLARSRAYLLQIHDYIRDATGKAWRVQARRDLDGMRVELALVDAAGMPARVTMPMSHEVDTLIPTEQEAMSTIERFLGPVTNVHQEEA